MQPMMLTTVEQAKKASEKGKNKNFILKLRVSYFLCPIIIDEDKESYSKF
jgi:hypothetical protein